MTALPSVFQDKPRSVPGAMAMKTPFALPVSRCAEAQNLDMWRMIGSHSRLVPPAAPDF